MRDPKKNEKMLAQTDRTKPSSYFATAQKVKQATDADIVKGLSNPIASTGTPISDLHGAARYNAQLSNIGGGSVETGGGGMRKGFNTVNQNTAARAVIASNSQSKKQPSLLERISKSFLK